MQPLVSEHTIFFLTCFTSLSLLELIFFSLGQLAEALLSLANLTTDEDAREALYMRAQAEGGYMVARELGGTIRPTRTRVHAHARTPRSRSRTMDVRMDES
jgi:hypothetical protein